MEKIGSGLNRQEISTTVKNILDHAETDDITSVDLDDNLPSKGWIHSFLKRYPEINVRTPENVSFQKDYINEESLRSWFQDLEMFLMEEHYLDATTFLSAENKNRIFNINEIGFPLQEKSEKFQKITERSCKNVNRLAPDTKEQVTVLACVSASGHFNKPFVIFPGKKLPKYNLSGVKESDFDAGYTLNGWISSDSFLRWLTNLFYASVHDEIQFPIIIFLDGHTSHINISVSDFCTDKGIILYCLPPYASHVLQPLDVSVFGPLKKLWNKSINEFKIKYRLAMSIQHFFPVFDSAWKEACSRPKNVISAFKSTGLVPFSVENVNFSKLFNFRHVRQSTNQFKTSDQERIGLMRALNMVEDEISIPTKLLFERRFDGHKAMLNNEDGKIWRIYRNIKKALNDEEEVDEEVVNEEEVAVKVENVTSEDTTVVNLEDSVSASLKYLTPFLEDHLGW